MRKYEDYCVGCPPEMGCLGSSCPNRDVAVDYCDKCGDYAQYRNNDDDEDLCEDCATKYLQSQYNNTDDYDGLSIEEMSEETEINITHIND